MDEAAESHGDKTSDRHATECNRLSLAFKNLEHLPLHNLDHFSHGINILDLSHNNLSDLSFLNRFPKLNSLILDHNKVNATTKFPSLLSLKVLWINHNCIAQLHPFIKHLSHAFPNLEFLSLMGNEAVPLLYDESTFYQHIQYRLFVISWLLSLQHLDDQPVEEWEKSEAQRLYKRPLLEQLTRKKPIQNLIKRVSAAIQLIQNQGQSNGFASAFI